MSVYFNPMKGAFLILKVFSQNLQDYWPMNFAKHDELDIGTVQFVLGVKHPGLRGNTRAALHPHS